MQRSRRKEQARGSRLSVLGFLVSQFLSIASNAAFGFVLARSVSLDDLGFISLPYSAFVFTIGVARASLGETLLYAPSADRLGLLPRWQALIKTARPLILLMVATTSLGAGLGPSRLFSVFAVLSVGGIVGVVQDLLRYAARRANRAKVALLGDVAWLLVSSCTWILLGRTHALTGLEVVFGWSFGGLAATCLMAALLRHLMVSDWPDNETMRKRLLIDGVLSGVAPLAAPPTLLLLASAGEAGKLRAVFFVLGPLIAVYAGGSFAFAPSLARGSHVEQVRLAALFGAVQATATVVYGAVIIATSDVVEALVGVSKARAISGSALFSGFVWAFTGALAAGFVLRARMSQDGLARILLFRYFALPAYLVGGAVAAALAGTTGYLLLSSTINLCLTWWILRWSFGRKKNETNR